MAQEGGGRWRTPLSVTRVVLGSILARVTVVGYWAANEVANTDRYVANMQPLIGEPPIQNALALGAHRLSPRIGEEWAAGRSARRRKGGRES